MYHSICIYDQSHFGEWRHSSCVLLEFKILWFENYRTSGIVHQQLGHHLDVSPHQISHFRTNGGGCVEDNVDNLSKEPVLVVRSGGHLANGPGEKVLSTSDGSGKKCRQTLETQKHLWRHARPESTPGSWAMCFASPSKREPRCSRERPSNWRRLSPPKEKEKGNSRPSSELMSGRGMDKEVVSPKTNGPWGSKALSSCRLP